MGSRPVDNGSPNFFLATRPSRPTRCLRYHDSPCKYHPPGFRITAFLSANNVSCPVQCCSLRRPCAIPVEYMVVLDVYGDLGFSQRVEGLLFWSPGTSSAEWFGYLSAGQSMILRYRILMSVTKASSHARGEADASELPT